MDKRIKNIVGQKFGRLTVIKYLYSKKHKPYWLCQCDCGNEYVACSGALIEIALTTPKTDRHKYYEYNGEKYTIQQLSKMFNIPEMTLYSRLNAGKLYKDNVFTAKGKRKV